MNKFNGKAIYCPSGKAGEYAEYACNFFVGCSNGCEYCYLTKGRSAKTYEHRYPKLKAHFKNEVHALSVFEKELEANLPELQEHGLFFSFTTDPTLGKTVDLTAEAALLSVQHDVPVKILTKYALHIAPVFLAKWEQVETDEQEWQTIPNPFNAYRNKIAIGFTLTGHDELEPHASTNSERIETMRKLHSAGFKTFASIEPVIDFESSKKMIVACEDCCDLFKIGLESGKRYSRPSLISFIDWCTLPDTDTGNKLTVYFKDGLLKQAGIDRESLPANCVGRDYNIFKGK